MIRRATPVLAMIALLAVGAAACGNSDPGVTPSAARALHDGVQLVRAAAAVRDRDAAAAAVDHLEQMLADLAAHGRVSADARARIRRAIARVRANLVLLPTTTTTTTTTRPDDERGKGHEKQHGHRKGDD